MEDVLDMSFNRALAQTEANRDCAIAQSLRDQPRYFSLSGTDPSVE